MFPLIVHLTEKQYYRFRFFLEDVQFYQSLFHSRYKILGDPALQISEALREHLSKKKIESLQASLLLGENLDTLDLSSLFPIVEKLNLGKNAGTIFSMIRFCVHTEPFFQKGDIVSFAEIENKEQTAEVLLVVNDKKELGFSYLLSYRCKGEFKKNQRELKLATTDEKRKFYLKHLFYRDA